MKKQPHSTISAQTVSSPVHTARQTGSRCGSIVRQFTNLGLIDEYLLVVVPVILGAGKPLFEKVRKTDLKLIEARSFGNGIVLLRYQPEK